MKGIFDMYKFKNVVILCIAITLVMCTACCKTSVKDATTTVYTNTSVTDVSNTVIKSEHAVSKHEYNGYIVLETNTEPLECFKENGTITDKQYEQSKFIIDNIDSTDKKIMKSLSSNEDTVSENDAKVYNAEISGIYEYNNKTYLFRGCHVMGSSNIYDLWCTDGNSVKYVGDFVSSKYEWMYPIKNGDSVIVTYEFKARGFDYDNSPIIASQVYLIKDDKLEEYKLQDNKQFFWFFDSEENETLDGNELYIFDKIEDGYIFPPEEITEIALNGDLKQEIAWVDGEIKIVSGYGVE